MNIGFIGLGIMGSRMAANLIRAGHTLAVYNRDNKKCQPLVDLGATQASSPAEACTGNDVIISMLSDPDAVASVALGEAGLLSGIRKGATWIDCSTIGPQAARRMADSATQHGVQFLEAPVTGSRAPAESGDLTFLVGGSAEDIDSVSELFDVMGAKTVHCGDHGSASSLKLVLNHLLGVSMLAFSEGLALGESLGIEREKLFDTLLATPLVPPYLSIKRDKLLSDDKTADFPLKWMNKDLALVCDAAYQNDVAMPLANSAKETYRLAQKHGLSNDDFARVYAFLQNAK